MVQEATSNVSMKKAAKKLYNIILPNYVHLESAYKHAKLIVEGLNSTTVVRGMWFEKAI